MIIYKGQTLNIMKNIFQKISLIALVLLFFAGTVCFSQVNTFGGARAEWSTSYNTKNKQVITFLEQNWTGKNQLKLQDLVDQQGLDCEFLWKVDPSQVQKALSSNSSFFTGQKPDLVELVFYSNGKVQINLYLQGKSCGCVRAWTSSKREGEYRQLSAGDYTVTGFNKNGYSKTFDSPMPNQILLSGEATKRSISIHTGDISGEKEGNTYHGCIRMGEVSGKNLFSLLSKGVSVKVIWK